MIRAYVVVAGVTLVAAAASAEPQRGATTTAPIRAVKIMPAKRSLTPPPAISKTIYLERCSGGCTITSDGNTQNAQTLQSPIPNPGQYNVAEFQNAAHQSGTAADAEWAMLLQCMKEVYSPFNVVVTDVKPTGGLTYHLALIAGTPGDINLGNDILGIAPLASDCSAQDNAISFSFANAHPQTDPVDRTFNICWTASQESAHAFGLDHEFAFQDGRSACNDPMTYRTDCGGEKFFRNQEATCGEFDARNCRCGPTQNSNLKILSVFGAGTSLIPPPSSTVTNPAEGTALGTVVVATSFSKRGVDHVDLVLNGFTWATAKGAPFGPQGQGENSYGLQVPGNLPSPSKYDIVAHACDDVGVCADSPVVHGFKGDPAGCVDASTCAEGQKCEAGKCFWDAPQGEVGDSCSFDQFCKSAMCSLTQDNQICTQGCAVGVDGSCPDGLDCVAFGNGGFCYFPDSGCCSVSHDSPARVLVHVGLAGLLLGFVMRRRKRK